MSYGVGRRCCDVGQQLQLQFDPWLGNLHVPWCGPIKAKKNKNKNKNKKQKKPKNKKTTTYLYLRFREVKHFNMYIRY